MLIYSLSYLYGPDATIIVYCIVLGLYLFGYSSEWSSFHYGMIFTFEILFGVDTSLGFSWWLTPLIVDSMAAWP